MTPPRQALSVQKKLPSIPIRWGRVHDLVALLAILTGGTIFEDYQTMHALAPSQLNRASLGGLGGLFRRLQTTLAPFCQQPVGSRLTSFAAVADLFVALIPVRREYEAQVRSLSPSELSLVLAAPGLTFADVIRHPEHYVLRRLAWQPDEASPEDIATGASYTLTTFNRLVGLRKDSVSAHHGAVPDPEPTYALIARATTLFSFDEAEVDVFRGGYTCSQSDTGTWHIAAPTELLGRAFELGYIGSAQQELLQRRGPPTPGHALLSEVAKEFARLCKEFFRVVDGPPRRIRLEMHTDVASETGYSRETRFIRKSSSG